MNVNPPLFTINQIKLFDNSLKFEINDNRDQSYSPETSSKKCYLYLFTVFFCFFIFLPFDSINCSF